MGKFKADSISLSVRYSITMRLLGLSLLVTLAGCIPLHSDCPSGWASYDTKCFKLFTSKASATEAESKCNEQGGNLPSIHSKAEQDFIYTNLDHSHSVWIGAVDPNQDGSWQWTDGSSFDFTNWGEEEPDNGSEVYVVMPALFDWRW